MSEQHSASLGEVVSRLFWMMAGPLLLALFGYSIIMTGNGWFTWADFAFLGVLAGMMLARWLEFRGGHPQTADGQPATAKHLRQFLVGVIVLGLATWVIANILANHVLGSG